MNYSKTGKRNNASGTELMLKLLKGGLCKNTMKLLSLLIISLMALAIVPMVLADGADIDIGGGVVVGPECNAPEIFVDHTARGWYPNDQTWYTAEEYGDLDEDGKYDCFAAGDEYDRYSVSERMNYAFEGETFDYYVLVRDVDGKEDIDTAQLLIKESGLDVGVGACRKVEQKDCAVTFDPVAFGVDKIKPATDQIFICKLIVPAKAGTWANGRKEVFVRATDGAIDNACEANPSTVKTVESDLTYFNPALSLTLTRGGSVNFGSVNPGTVATSNSIYLANQVPGVNEESGVVMDIYIASDDYFTDPTNADALCPTGNGIKYDQFSYYATKGSLNSGANNNAFPGLGETAYGMCIARGDEFTVLPSHSGNIDDMCRVINWKKDASLLTQGSEMSITFRLDVPDVCRGNFNNGQFHFAGRVV